MSDEDHLENSGRHFSRSVCKIMRHVPDVRVNFKNLPMPENIIQIPGKICCSPEKKQK